MASSSVTSSRAIDDEASAPIDFASLRSDFPILAQTVNGKPLVYLDNAATTQKPLAVIDAVSDFYRSSNANIHRGVHHLSMRATEAYESARVKLQRFIGAERPEEIVFVRGTTEALNLVAESFGRLRIGRGDEIVISTMEHHSNIVPWQLLCERTGARLRVIPINDRGELLVDDYEKLLGPRTRLVSVVYVSNALGTVNPVRDIIRLAHERDIAVMLDGAQATPHLPINVAELGCEFFTLSGHKMFGPTGSGVLYGRFDLLNEMPPYQSGGDMIKSVSFGGTIYNDLPHRFEAGTPDVAAAIGLGAAVDYLNRIGMQNIAAYEQELLAYATQQLAAIPAVRLIGTAREKASVLSFVVNNVHAHDVGTILDQAGVAIRTGHHCAQPVMERFGVTATARASIALYNNRRDIDAMVAALGDVVEMFGP